MELNIVKIVPILSQLWQRYQQYGHINMRIMIVWYNKTAMWSEDQKSLCILLITKFLLRLQDYICGNPPAVCHFMDQYVKPRNVKNVNESLRS